MDDQQPANVDLLYFSEFFLKTEDCFAYVYTGENHTPHKHVDFYEFALVTNGSFINEHNGRKHRFDRAALFFHRSGETHRIVENEPNSSYLSFVIQKDGFEKFCAQHFPQIPALPATSHRERRLTHEQFEYITAVFNTVDLTPMENHLALFELMLFTLIHCCFVQVPASGNPAEKHDTHWYIKEMLYHFDRFEYLRTSVEDIYRDYPLSPSALAHQFKKNTGYTIVQYRHAKRMEYAALMLTKSPQSVTEVAASIGYNSLSYFSKKFKEHFGRLPSEYHPRTLNRNALPTIRASIKARSVGRDDE